MNKKETLVKHAVKKAAAALRILFIPALLLSTAMNVQAFEETPAQPENIVKEAQAETEPAEVMPAPAESTADETQAQTEDISEPMSVTMIGDSVMLGAAPSILEMLPDCVIDAKVSRQVTQADSVLDSLEQQNTLNQTVVIALGTNGPFSTDTGQEIIDRLGSERTIYWVTVYGRELKWQEDSNAAIRKLAEDNENVHIIDWSQIAPEHAEWLYSDGIHLTAEGRKGYAQMILADLY